MSYFRTPEHKALRAALIRKWKPWAHSTGPKSPEGKAKAARNAFKGGHRAELRRLSRATNAMLRAIRERDLPAAEAARVMGSRGRLQRVLDGADPVEVVNRGVADGYRTVRMGEVVQNRAVPRSMPNYENAIVAPDKLRRYALNPDSEVGAHKARVFESVLGFTLANADELESQLLRNLPSVPALERRATIYGRQFTADIPVTGPRGSGIVRTGWQIDTGSDVPRLVSLYVLLR